MKATPDNHDEDLKKAERIAYLIAGHLRANLNPKEQDELDAWIVESDDNLALFERLTDEDNIEMAMQQYMQAEGQKPGVLTAIKQTIRQEERMPLTQRIWPYIAVASLIILAISIYYLVPVDKENNPGAQLSYNGKTGIKPGEDRAVLTLSDGRTIILDSTGDGLLALEGNISITKDSAGQIIYKGTDQQMKYNVVSTPRGGQYSLVLGDGTKVWLNAESSLKFPAGFAPTQRNVELKGEAYFEVAKNLSSPFKVLITSPLGNAGEVEVLGTRFNIDGYADEGSVKASLLEGSIKIEKDGRSKILNPGEQASVSNDITVIKTNVGEAIAWKDGKFLFRDATIQTIAQEIKRWYDVEVEYRGKVSQHFNIEVTRHAPLSSILEGLEGTGQVRFELAGKKLIIKP